MYNYFDRTNALDLLDEENPFFQMFNSLTKESKTMKTDIIENEKEYVIEVEVAGLEKKDIKISLEDKYLTVEASKKNELKEGSKLIRSERFYGTMSRSYYVGDIEQKDIKAEMKDGVLSITLPKECYEKQEEKKFIEIN